MSKGKPLVTGSIILGREVREFAGATVYVRLEDVSRADTIAVLIGEQVLDKVSHRAGTEETLDFAVYGELPTESGDYNVSVHIDLDGDGQVSRSDYITVESFPVRVPGAAERVRIRVEEVG